eukprot:TRINITY_DN352_c1_g1_i1.p1 TRINITY_DN352_c1_g1~~TRINITY_DN352_c1_g1_i1.p1  ORF type:complete len:878 (-),score=240.74 TRINITY_DN352_c1_g1_i1:124-2757(-)
MTEKPNNSKWEEVQKKAFLHWVNSKLSKKNERIEDIITGFNNGIMLISLVEILSQKIITQKYIKQPDLPIHKITNCYIAIKFLQDDCKVKGITGSAEDIVSGQSKFVLGLCWILMKHFQSIKLLGGSFNDSEHNSGGSTEGESSFEKLLLQWCKETLKNYSDINLNAGYKSDAFSNGKALLALINEFQPGEIDYSSFHSEDGKQNCESAVKLAEKYIGIPSDLIDPDELSKGKTSEKNLVLYLSLFENAFKDRVVVQTTESLESKIRSLEAQLSKLNSENHTLKSENNALQEKLSSSSSMASPEIMSQLESLKLRQQSDTNEIEQLKSTITTLNQRCEGYESTIASLNEQIATMKTKGEDSDSVAKLKEQLAVAQQKLVIATEQLNKMHTFASPKKQKVKLSVVPLNMETESTISQKQDKLVDWIQKSTGFKFSPDKTLFEYLQDGSLLCKIMNSVKPGSIAKFNEGPNIHYIKQMENIHAYLGGCWDLGIPGDSLFSPKDLQSEANFEKVINNLLEVKNLTDSRSGESHILSDTTLLGHEHFIADPEKYLEINELESKLSNIPDDEGLFNVLKDTKIDLARWYKLIKDAERRISGLEQDKVFYEKALSQLKEDVENVGDSNMAITDEFIFGESSKTQRLKKDQENFGSEAVFYFDAQLDPTRIKQLNAFLSKILQGGSIDSTYAQNFKNMFSVDSGRRLFVHLLRRHVSLKPEFIVSDDGFDAILYLINLCLSQFKNLSHGADSLTAQGILNCSPKIKRNKVDKSTKKMIVEELTFYIKTNQIWKDYAFWEDFFWQSLTSLPEFKQMQSGFNENQKKVIASFLPEFVRKQMWGWGTTSYEEMELFVKNISKQTDLESYLKDKVMDKIRVFYEFNAE